jgi:phosphate/sulfate permease
METYYLILVLILFFLAISDIIVGVANDAVNFLNSAVGAKAATFKTIMIVATLGILVGATFSGGMMEVARSGIFNPQHFLFSEILVIFLAVMIADVILLDIFNTYGMPTSTTVSLVFELLGAAVAVSIFKIMNNPEALPLGAYINSAKAFTIVTSILLSVVLAFSSGIIIQFLSRLLFSFDYKKKLKYFGAVWGGIALTAIMYFMVIKGSKGASFMTDEIQAFIDTHTNTLMLATLVVSIIVFQILTLFTKFNVLQFVVLAGTFALAMAFAGNDLVNFIGVPLAGYESFKTWTASGLAPDAFTMEGLAGKVKTPTVFLLMAGLIMAVTLWTSKKARSVIKTSVDLSRQEEGYERFEPTFISKSIVRTFTSSAAFFERVIPNKMMLAIDSRFDQSAFIEVQHAKREDAPSFDMIRASVTLIVASILISMGTTLKLPLSTTYVTFMVAMGTSLADGAWGRESAVYRVSGVLSVISGWFITAFSAFSMAFIVAFAFYFGGKFAIFPILGVAIYLMYRTHKLHDKRVDEQKTAEIDESEHITKENAIQLSGENVERVFTSLGKVLSDTIIGMETEDLKLLQKTAKLEKKVNNKILTSKNNYSRVLSKLGGDADMGYYYIIVIDYLLEISHCVHNIIRPTLSHVDNNHKPYIPEQIEELKVLDEQIQRLLVLTINVFKELKVEDAQKIYDGLDPYFKLIKKYRKAQIQRIKANKVGTRNSNLFFNALGEYRDIALFCNRLVQSCDSLLLNPTVEEDI